MIRVADVRALVFRAPAETPVVTSFARMVSRPMLLVRVEDAEGAAGWGEVWCNFPACGAEHRARLVETVFAPLLAGHDFAGPEQAFDELTRRTRILAIQAAEPGPLAQCIAGLDIALWDLEARRRGLPLWRCLGGAGPRIRVYASGLNPESPERLAERRLAEGHRAFKLKVGFGKARDRRNLDALRGLLGGGCTLMVDANQAWDAGAAVEAARDLSRFELRWLEEPVPADTPWPEWRAIADAGIPLAAGENLAGPEKFGAAIGAGVLAVVQPDAAKWGGFSGCLPVARRIVTAGLTFCPHFLGGGVGLRASAHLLAAAGGTGMLEIDANDNLLRSALAGPLGTVTDGSCVLDEAPGLGAPPDIDSLREFLV